jgi:hypothetical protein
VLLSFHGRIVSADEARSWWAGWAALSAALPDEEPEGSQDLRRLHLARLVLDACGHAGAAAENPTPQIAPEPEPPAAEEAPEPQRRDGDAAGLATSARLVLAGLEFSVLTQSEAVQDHDAMTIAIRDASSVAADLMPYLSGAGTAYRAAWEAVLQAGIDLRSSRSPEGLERLAAALRALRDEDPASFPDEHAAAQWAMEIRPRQRAAAEACRALAESLRVAPPAAESPAPAPPVPEAFVPQVVVRRRPPPRRAPGMRAPSVSLPVARHPPDPEEGGQPVADPAVSVPPAPEPVVADPALAKPLADAPSPPEDLAAEASAPAVAPIPEAEPVPAAPEEAPAPVPDIEEPVPEDTRHAPQVSAEAAVPGEPAADAGGRQEPTRNGRIILDAMRGRPPMRKTDIAVLAGIGRGAANRSVDRLVQDGWMVPAGAALFRVPGPQEPSAGT